MWAAYFDHPDSRIFGVDRDLSAVDSALQDTLSGDQRVCLVSRDLGGEEFRRWIMAEPHFDIIIDDAEHTMSQQQYLLYQLLPRLTHGGLYILEDLHTSLMEPFQEGRGFSASSLNLLVNLRGDASTPFDCAFVDETQVKEIGWQIENIELWHRPAAPHESTSAVIRARHHDGHGAVSPPA